MTKVAERTYFVLMAGYDSDHLEDSHIHYFVNKRGEKILWVFSSRAEAERFVRKYVNKSQAYLDYIEQHGLNLPEAVKEGKEFSVVAKMNTEALAILAGGLGMDHIALDPRPGHVRTLAIPK